MNNEQPPNAIRDQKYVESPDPPFHKYRPWRPKARQKRCAHCCRTRLAKFIEWHPGIRAWQCTDFGNCDRARGIL